MDNGLRNWKIITERMLGESIESFVDRSVWGALVSNEVMQYCNNKNITLSDAYQEVQEKKSGLIRNQRNWLLTHYKNK